MIPCYRSEKTIRSVIAEIDAVVAQRPQYDYEVICVNDASPDNVYAVLTELAGENRRVKVVNFAKNMGKHAAVLAGYHYALGEYVVNLDDDLQSPVPELWKLLDPLISDECDYVTARYYQKKQAGWKNLGSNINMLMSIILLDKPKDLRFDNFSAMRAFVAAEMTKYTRPYPYLEGLVLRVTRRIKMVDMEQRERGDDLSTGYTFGKSFSLWLNGFTAFSVKPLRIATFVGVSSAIIGMIYGLVMIIRKLVNPVAPLGYTSLLAVLLFIGGLLLMSVGLLGEYVGRIYICLNQSPQYVVRDTINLNPAENSLNCQQNEVGEQ